MSVQKPALPVYVDLDGTLIKTDSLWESILVYLRRAPWRVFTLVPLLCFGRSRFKDYLARRVGLQVERLPYRKTLLQTLRRYKQEGHALYLATAAHRSIAEAVSRHLGLFDAVLSSDADHNLKGANKAAEILRRDAEFIYIGDHKADLVVWQQAKQAIMIGGTPQLERQLKRLAPTSQSLEIENPKRLRHSLRAMRIYQWSKNSLLFLPLALAHRWFELESWLLLGLAFLVWGLMASAIYIGNDLVDLESDRQHPSKCRRPLAAGDLSIPYGIFLSLGLASVSLATSLLLLPLGFSVMLGVYGVITSAYSLGLKRLVLVDVFVLAFLYCWRIAAGAVAVQVPVSFWLLAFSSCFFLSLALVKRAKELQALTDLSRSGRAYRKEDEAFIKTLGLGLGLASVIILMLYTQNASVQILYRQADWLWVAIFALLGWITRIWFLLNRGEMDDDPIYFAMRDPYSYLTVGLCGLAGFLAS